MYEQKLCHSQQIIHFQLFVKTSIRFISLINHFNNCTQGYISDLWNIFDMFIVIGSLIDIIIMVAQQVVSYWSSTVNVQACPIRM